MSIDSLKIKMLLKKAEFNLAVKTKHRDFRYHENLSMPLAKFISIFGEDKKATYTAPNGETYYSFFFEQNYGKRCDRIELLYLTNHKLDEKGHVPIKIMSNGNIISDFKLFLLNCFRIVDDLEPISTGNTFK